MLEADVVNRFEKIAEFLNVGLIQFWQFKFNNIFKRRESSRIDLLSKIKKKKRQHQFKCAIRKQVSERDNYIG